jgi:hypothetical protein
MEYTVPRGFSSQSSDGECDSTVENSCLSGAYTLNASPDPMEVLCCVLLHLRGCRYDDIGGAKGRAPYIFIYFNLATT